MLDTSDANGNKQLEENEDMPNMVSNSSSDTSSSDSFPSSGSDNEYYNNLFGNTQNRPDGCSCTLIGIVK